MLSRASSDQQVVRDGCRKYQSSERRRLSTDSAMCREGVERWNSYWNRYVAKNPRLAHPFSTRGAKVEYQNELTYWHDLPGGQNIAVVLGTYQPDVQCRGPFGAWPSCRSILGDMPVLTTTEIFGPPEDPVVQIALPQFLESSQ